MPKFHRMKMDYVIKDQYGNVLIQFPSEADANFVVESWQGYYLNPHGSKDSTKARKMQNK